MDPSTNNDKPQAPTLNKPLFIYMSVYLLANFQIYDSQNSVARYRELVLLFSIPFPLLSAIGILLLGYFFQRRAKASKAFQVSLVILAILAMSTIFGDFVAMSNT